MEMPTEDTNEAEKKIIANEDEHALPFVFMFIFAGGIGTLIKMNNYTGKYGKDFFII